MKFKNYLAGIDSVTIYPLISLLLFIGFFTGVVIYVIRMKKSSTDVYSQLPIDEN